MSGFRNLNFLKPQTVDSADDDWDTAAESAHNPFAAKQGEQEQVAVAPVSQGNSNGVFVPEPVSVARRASDIEQRRPSAEIKPTPPPVSVKPYSTTTQAFHPKTTAPPPQKLQPHDDSYVSPKDVISGFEKKSLESLNQQAPKAPSPVKSFGSAHNISKGIAANFEKKSQESLAFKAPSTNRLHNAPSHLSVASSMASLSSAKRSSFSMNAIDANQLQLKFPKFTVSEISAYYQQFAQSMKEQADLVHQNDLSSVATKAGQSYQDVLSKLANLKLSNPEGYVSFEGFLTAVSSLRSNMTGSTSNLDKKQIRLHGAHENITHTINEDEKESFVQHINVQLGNDPDVGPRLPIDPTTMEIFPECRDGLILAKLINDAVPGTIDERVLNIKKISHFQMIENNNVVINSAKAIGCSVVNIGSQDLIEGREHLILGLIWQIIRTGLSAKVDIRFHPELYRLLEPGEGIEDFLKLPTEKILLRWFNYHLKQAGWHRRVENFSGDVKDGENYTVLLNQLAPSVCSRAPLQQPDLLTRAEMVLQNADKLGCRKYLTAKTMVNGNVKLNFAFVANLFNTIPGLEALDESEKAKLDDWLFGSEGDREARAFALWLNSLGIEPFVNNLYDDVSDGLILLQAIDHIHPKLVDWKKVNKGPLTSKFKKVENTNYVMELGKRLNFTLVAIQGSDITDGVKTLILGYVWQLMREHVIQTLKSLSKHGRDITDADMITWANGTVKRGGKHGQIHSFKDPVLRNGVYLLELLNGMNPGVVDFSMVSRGMDDESCKMNAKYAISIARKLGATIFVLPEDIVEVKPKMILTFIGTLMALDRN